MTWIDTVPPEEATGNVRDLYDRAGTIWQNLSLRPSAALAAHGLIDAVRSTTTPRLFELVYFVGASRLKCTVCTLGHGLRLIREFITVDQLEAVLVGDFDHASLEPREVAALTFVDALICHPHEIREVDIDALRKCGYTDAQILDVILIASVAGFVTIEANATGFALGPNSLATMRSAFGDALFRALQVGRVYEC